MNKRIYKIRNGKICGVCGGIGEFLDIDPTIIRLVWAISAFAGVGLFAYFVAALILPYQDQI
ncbi:MAG: PspC domain-containing protein [Oscillospiraceae bacterium]|nr:PspC domain-containing protein [Oscillospiraceae bacterium]